MGVLVLLALAPRRLSVVATLAVCVVPLMAAIARVGSEDALTDEFVRRADQIDAGHAAAPVVLALAVAAALVQAVLSGKWLPSDVRRSLARAARPIGVGLAILTVLAAGAFYILHLDDVEGGSGAATPRQRRPGSTASGTSS